MHLIYYARNRNNRKICFWLGKSIQFQCEKNFFWLHKHTQKLAYEHINPGKKHRKHHKNQNRISMIIEKYVEVTWCLLTRAEQIMKIQRWKWLNCGCCCDSEYALGLVFVLCCDCDCDSLVSECRVLPNFCTSPFFPSTSTNKQKTMRLCSVVPVSCFFVISLSRSRPMCATVCVLSIPVCSGNMLWDW